MHEADEKIDLTGCIIQLPLCLSIFEAFGAHVVVHFAPIKSTSGYTWCWPFGFVIVHAVWCFEKAETNVEGKFGN